MDENDLKIRLIDYLLSSSTAQNDSLIVEELPYFDGKRRADIVKISEHSHVFEIKSDLDNTSKLLEQISDYKKVFDFITIATTPSHYKKIRNMVTRSVGLLIIEANRTTLKRKPTMHIRKNNFALVSFLNRAELDELFKKNEISHSKAKSLTEKRDLAAKTIDTESIKYHVLECLRRKKNNSYKLFLAYKSLNTHIDDLELLKLNSYATP